MQSNLVPVTVLTGFLGAGKTTLLNRILSEQHGHRIAVIENEFGPEGVDNELLVQDQNENIVEMNNGCICCTVRGDLSRILVDLAQKRRAGTLDFERVIIETTGMANPGPVAQTFFMDDDVASSYLLDAVLTVVDAKHGHDTLTKQAEARNQVGFADRILLSKADLVSADDLEGLRQRLVRMNPRATISPVNFGNARIADLLDIRGFNLTAILELDPDFLAEEHPDAHAAHEHGHEDEHGHAHGQEPEHACDEHCDHEGHVHGEHHGHEHKMHAHHHHHDDDIKAFAFRAEKPFDALLLEEFLSAIVDVYGVDMLRYKGILWVNGSARRIVFQGVHMLMGSDLGRAWGENEARSSKMVFIGRNLPRDTIIQGLQNCLAGADVPAMQAAA